MVVFVIINGVVPDIAVVYSLQHLEFTQYHVQQSISDHMHDI